MRKTFGDMARSLGVMAVIVAAVLLIGGRQLIWPGSRDRMAPVDYTDVVAGFHQATGIAALAPAGLPSSWRANAARLDPASPAPARSLHIGWAVPGSHYAGLDEGDGDGSQLVLSVLGTRGATPTGAVTIDGTTWQRRTSDRGEPALTRTAGRLTVVITGDAGEQQLERLAASLR
jgi:hypothetical protein